MTAKPRFEVIGITGKPGNAAVAETAKALAKLIESTGRPVFLPNELGSSLGRSPDLCLPAEKLGSDCDLIVVVGGDGSMLKAGRDYLEAQSPLLGINRGHLGFLTDIGPTELERVLPILDGHYLEESRFILKCEVSRNGETFGASRAVNDVVLYPGEIAKLLEFELHIDGHFVYSQRSDGLIVSTPTGSTAYSMSGGGSIMSPDLNAIALVPMLPHSLTSRPLTVSNSSVLDIHISAENKQPPQLSCDGQVIFSMAPGDHIRIFRHPTNMRLIHPADYDYYAVLRTKLHWGQRL